MGGDKNFILPLRYIFQCLHLWRSEGRERERKRETLSSLAENHSRPQDQQYKSLISKSLLTGDREMNTQLTKI